MRESLQRAIAEIEKLPAEEQDAVAERILSGLDADRKWDALFDATTDEQWARIEAMARRDIAEGTISLEDFLDECENALANGDAGAISDAPATSGSAAARNGVAANSHPNAYTAIIRRDGDWWIGWIGEVPGVTCQEATREELLDTLRITLKEMLEINMEDAAASMEGDYQTERIFA